MVALPARQVTSVDRFHAAIVEAHEAIKKAGYTPNIYEDGFYDPVDYNHMPASWHFHKQKTAGGLWVALAADINVVADVNTENKVLNQVVVPIMKKHGVAFICPETPTTYIKDHSGENQHLHADCGPYGIQRFSDGLGVIQPWAGRPGVSVAPKAAPEKLAEDGVFGTQTRAALQKALGVKADGIFGVVSVKALQTYLNKKTAAKLVVDGRMGKLTIMALQKYLGTKVDGVLSVPSSSAIKALQNRLNAKTF